MVLAFSQRRTPGKEEGEDGKFFEKSAFSGFVPFLFAELKQVRGRIAPGEPRGRAHTGGMTDQPASSPSADPQKRKARNPYIVPFHAVIKMFSTVKLLDEDQAEIVLNGHRLTLPIAASQLERVRKNPQEPGQTYYVWLWFRTAEGLVVDVELGGFSPPREDQLKEISDTKKIGFQVAGRVEAVNKDEGFLTMEIKPNSVGNLQEPFFVEIWAALELLEKVQRVGRTMIISGEYRPGSGRLVAQDMKPKSVGKSPEKKKGKAEEGTSG